jgi:hypothetical protein
MTHENRRSARMVREREPAYVTVAKELAVMASLILLGASLALCVRHLGGSL